MAIAAPNGPNSEWEGQRVAAPAILNTPQHTLATQLKLTFKVSSEVGDQGGDAFANGPVSKWVQASVMCVRF